MKLLVGFFAAGLIIVGGFFMFNSYIYNEKQGESENQVAPEDVIDVQPVSHASSVITWGTSVIYTDPTGGANAYANRQPAQLVLITDIHGDHLSTSTLEAVVGGAVVVAPQAVADLLPDSLKAKTIVLRNGETTTEAGFSITAVPMYNVPETADARHTKGRGNGYIVEKNGQRLYVAGDTGGTPEMRALTDIDIALVPMNPPFTMTVAEAADAVLAFAPKHVYPYHYRGQDGLNDTAQFKSLVNAGNPNIDVVLLNWYPQQ